jgi:predicted ATPase/GAF domain-containing protein
MQQLEVSQSSEVKRCALFQLHRVTTPAGKKLLVKSFTSDSGNSDLLKHEQATFARLGSLRLAQSQGLVHVRDQVGACYADFPGEPLRHARLRDHAELAKLARELCAVLDEFHAAGLLIRGLSPRSFLIDAAGRLQLVDAPFALAMGADQGGLSEGDWIRSPFLPYAAPEVLRAMEHPVQRTADLYALGAVLYELLGGRPPFAGHDPAELIQSHLARQPKPLAELSPELPGALTNAVMQLLEKNPARRPASTSDFLRSAALVERDERDGTNAYSPTKQSPIWSTRMYGREAAWRELRSSLEESTKCVVTLVRGEPGSGKTSLLEELRKAPFVHTSCWGKFTRGGTGQPLSGWSDLTRALAAAALSSSPVEFRRLRQQVEEVLGGSGPALVSLAPEWDAVLRCGRGPAEHFEGGLNRTAVALQRLLSCYADAASPIWVFLDDLQWADASSLRILELILTLPSAPNLRVLASVRSPEPGDERADLDGLMASLERGGIDVDVVDLQGLAVPDLKAFVHDSLGPEVVGLDQLLQFLSDKTHGNPFFVRELLAALVSEGGLERRDGLWRWTGATSPVGLPDSLLDLLTRRVHQLSVETKKLLVVAACIGDVVRRSDLCVATGLDADAVDDCMQAATAAGLVNEHDGDDETTYRFAHDRILEASLALASTTERATLSIRLFNLLAVEATSNDGGLTFTLANLFNAGSSEIETDAERLAGVFVNQTAGEVAKAKGAYAQALHHLSRAAEGLSLLPGETRWTVQAELSRTVYCQAAEAALLCSRFELTTKWCQEVLSHSTTALQKAVAHEFLIRALAAQKRFGEAVEKALEAQSELDVHFPRNPKMAHVIWGYIWTLRRVKRLGPERLSRLPPRRDEESAAASRLLQAVFAITHFHKPELFPLFIYRQVEQCTTHGNDAYASQAYGALSMILAGLGEVQLAREVGRVSLTLPSTPAGDKLRCRSEFTVASFVEPWLVPVRETFPQLQRAAQGALENGDFEFFGYGVTMRGLGQLYTASGLAELTAEFENNLNQLRALGQERNTLMQSLICQAAHDLRHGAPNGPLSGSFYEREAGLAVCQKPMDHTLVFHHYLAELCVASHLGDVRAAERAVESVQPHIANGAFGSYLQSVFSFYEAWTIAVSRRAGAKRRLRRHHKQLLGWSKKAPANFLSKLRFVEAERRRLAGRLDEAARAYESAIEEARAQSYFHEAALAHERAASLWSERGFSRLAGQHLRDAYSLYRHWGALGPAQRLNSAYPQHFSLLPARSGTSYDSMRPAESLDYGALIKASQAISGEVLLPRLLERLLQTIMEHTAAQRGVLLLEQRGELVVAASGDVDKPQVQLVADETIENTERVSRAIVRYAARLEKTVVLAEATEDATFGRDPYVQAQRSRSVLCTPITYQTKLLGLIYLENDLMSHVFTAVRLEMVKLLATQAGISIANARFHALQLEAQQAKISPHFLFNALSSIAELATIDGTKAETAIVKLSHLYRYILASSANELVALERELAIVRDYLSLEKLRFGSKLEFSVTHEGPLDTVRVPGLLIQPLVENSIRHAVAPKMSDGRVWVHARVQNDRCNIVVRDDGDGTKHPSSGTGFGLRSVQQRLELVYGSHFSFAISQHGGYRVELEVPCEASSPSN